MSLGENALEQEISGNQFHYVLKGYNSLGKIPHSAVRDLALLTTSDDLSWRTLKGPCGCPGSGPEYTVQEGIVLKNDTMGSRGGPGP